MSNTAKNSDILTISLNVYNYFDSPIKLFSYLYSELLQKINFKIS